MHLCSHLATAWIRPALGYHNPQYDPRKDKRLDELLRDQARELDPTRCVHLNFMFVEDWPSITWTVADYFRRPKAGCHTL